MVEISVVVPAYNEKNNISISLTKISTFLNDFQPDYEIIVVDDGSADSTKDLVKSIQRVNKRVELVENPHKGKAFAVRTGVLRSQGRFVLMTDVDLSTPIEELKRFMVWIRDSGYDIAIASREGIGAVRKNEPYIRHLMGRIFNYIVQLVVLPGINDTQCGFKLFKGDLARKIFGMSLLYGDSSKEIRAPKLTGFDVEVLFIARKMGLRIKEIPVTWEYGKYTKVNKIRDSLTNLLDVLRVKVNDIRGLYKL